ncbi:hypothetical protein J6590_095732 [Homalodisca vitripennis]|nr:hypothetical protein J6590_095732 [Homalodisca vitripennis]
MLFSFKKHHTRNPQSLDKIETCTGSLGETKVQDVIRRRVQCCQIALSDASHFSSTPRISSCSCLRRAETKDPDRAAEHYLLRQFVIRA